MQTRSPVGSPGTRVDGKIRNSDFIPLDLHTRPGRASEGGVGGLGGGGVGAVGDAHRLLQTDKGGAAGEEDERSPPA